MTEEQIQKLKEAVDHQANMHTLWPPVPASIHEALIASALRHLHAIIEGDFEMEILAKAEYWDLESEL